MLFFSLLKGIGILLVELVARRDDFYLGVIIDEKRGGTRGGGEGEADILKGIRGRKTTAYSGYNVNNLFPEKEKKGGGGKGDVKRVLPCRSRCKRRRWVGMKGNPYTIFV